MKTFIVPQLDIVKVSQAICTTTLAVMLSFGANTARADETCSSPYLARIDGQEEFVYVWTLGVEGLGDGADKLVTVDVKPGSPNYGKVSAAFRSRAETKRTMADSLTTGISFGWPGLKRVAFLSSTSTPTRRNRNWLRRSTNSLKQLAARLDHTVRMPCRAGC